MRCKKLITAIVILVIHTTGCSTLNKVVYRPDINQGNYLSSDDVSKIHKNMTQQQVAYTLGTPMLHDPFSTKTWFYVFRQQSGQEKVLQRTLILHFDSDGVLTDIENLPVLGEAENNFRNLPNARS